MKFEKELYCSVVFQYAQHSHISAFSLRLKYVQPFQIFKFFFTLVYKQTHPWSQKNILVNFLSYLLNIYKKKTLWEITPSQWNMLKSCKSTQFHREMRQRQLANKPWRNSQCGLAMQRQEKLLLLGDGEALHGGAGGAGGVCIFLWRLCRIRIARCKFTSFG